MTFRPVFPLAACCVLFASSCGQVEDREDRPPAVGIGDGKDIPEPPECEPPKEVSLGRSCGSETVTLQKRIPSVYFVLDVSGSMSEHVLDGNETKLEAATEALTTVAEEVGHRMKYGLSVFPGVDELEDVEIDPEDPPLLGCAPGQELLPVTAGDPIECTNFRPNGPVLRKFRAALRDLEPSGGTPLSPTINALAPTLLAQEGQTAVILVTDGSPNCNPSAVCASELCEANRYGGSIGTLLCDETLNCCDPEAVGDLLSHPAAGCIDVDESEAKLAELSSAGITTYVVGVMGEENFDDVMNRLAIAGGKPRSGDRAYFDVESLSELTTAVRTIGADLTQSCEIELLERPAFANELNVYFDGEVLPNDPENGWTIIEDTVSIHGSACDTITEGKVEEVQLVSGCLTVVK